MSLYYSLNFCKELKEINLINNERGQEFHIDLHNQVLKMKATLNSSVGHLKNLASLLWLKLGLYVQG